MNTGKITFSYDSEADVLYIAFGTNRPGIGLSINDSILLRVDRKMKNLIGLTIFDYHETGQREPLELYGLREMDTQAKAFALDLLLKAPLNRFFLLTNNGKNTHYVEPTLKELRVETLLLAA